VKGVLFVSKEGEQGSRFLNMAVGSLLGGALATVIVLVLLLACAAAISSGMLAEELELHVTIAACVVGGFCGGELAKKRWGCKPLLAGLSAGAVFFLILLTVSLVGFGGADISGSGLGVMAGCLCGGAIAGLLSRGGGKRKKKRRSY